MYLFLSEIWGAGIFPHPMIYHTTSFNIDPAQQFHILNNPIYQETLNTFYQEPIMPHPIQWKKYHPLSDQNAFICLVDHMGDDAAIVQAARVSYGKDEQETTIKSEMEVIKREISPLDIQFGPTKEFTQLRDKLKEQREKDRQLIRYLMNHSHTTPFEMVEIKFMVQVPMDCWRQWVRHRTASINEYSTRYTEALDFFQVTAPTEWRLQATDNKQGSNGFLTDWPEGIAPIRLGHEEQNYPPGEYLSDKEHFIHKQITELYQERLAMGIAKEQARKDLPLSTYTRAYWKCDLHNIFNFLRLRMDSHAQLEIRSFANCMFEIVKQICPVACEAFEDYVLHAKKFSRMEMEILRTIFVEHKKLTEYSNAHAIFNDKPDTITDREWKEFLIKLQG